jgi:NarL family two-component system response regulator LiaR
MSQGDKIRVLVVDNHATVRKGLATFLDSVDNLVLVAEATNGPEALHFCYLFQPDVVLMDLQTPGLDPATVTRLIRQLYSNTQIIVLTSGNEDKGLIDSALKAGAVISLQKSVSAGELTQAIEAAYADKTDRLKRKGDAASWDQPPRLR